MTEDSNGTGTVFTVKDWARLVYQELKEMKDKFSICQAEIRDIPEIKKELREVSKKLDELSDDVLEIQIKAKISATMRATWVSLLTGGSVAGIIEIIIHAVK